MILFSLEIVDPRTLPALRTPSPPLQYLPLLSLHRCGRRSGGELGGRRERHSTCILFNLSLSEAMLLFRACVRLICAVSLVGLYNVHAACIIVFALSRRPGGSPSSTFTVYKIKEDETNRP